MKNILLAFYPLLFAGLLLAKSNPAITVQELQDHVSYLASDALAGRKPATAGDDSAAAYIKRQLAHKWVTFPEDGFQHFDIVAALELGEGNVLAFDDTVLTVRRDFMPFAFSSGATLEAPAAFVGYGFDIKNDSLAWNDYDGIDVAGRWVLVLRGDPELDDPASPFAPHSGVRAKAFIAKDHGAAGVLTVSGENFDAKDDLPQLLVQDGHTSVGLPVVQIKKAFADLLLAQTGLTVDSLETLLNEQRSPKSFSLNQTVRAVVDVQRVTGRTQNVVALLPGSDRTLKDEVVVIGAHYDHLGMGGPGGGSRRPDTLAVHNGADDNASGVALALELFEKLAANRKQLKRSVLFIAFGAEEMGSLGAKHFTQHPLVDLQNIAFMFNFDMVGRLDSTLTLFGVGTADGLDSLAVTKAKPHGLKLTLSPEGLGPSDHAAFYAENIPVLMFFTGMHGDYHTPNDDVELLNFDGKKRIAEFAYDLVLEMTNRPTAPVFQIAGPQERAPSRRQLKVTLGIMPDMAGQEKRGLRVDAVTPDRPAFRAGVKKGDVIVAIEGKPVADIYEYMHRLGELKVGQRVSVEVLRGEERLILIAEL